MPGRHAVPAGRRRTSASAAAASNAQYQYTLQGDNLDDSERLGAAAARQDCDACPDLADVNTDQQNHGLQATLDDRPRHRRAPRASRRRRSTTTLYDAFGQRQVSTMYTALNQYHVVMEVAPRVPAEIPEALQQIYVRSPDGAQVPLSAFAHYAARRPRRCRSITRGSSRRSRCRSTSRPAWRWATRCARSSTAEREIGMPATMHGSFPGTAQAFQESLSEPAAC